MAGIKGAKQKRKLSKDEQQQVYAMLKRDGTQLLTLSHLKELKMNRVTYMRRANVTSFNVVVGYEWSDVEDLSASSKSRVGFICEVCGKSVITPLGCIRKRRIPSLRYCGQCYLKFNANTIEQRIKNSEAQKIAQNRPEVIVKHRENTRRMWQDPNSAIRDCRCQPYSGTYKSIRYDSLLELAFIMLSLESGSTIRRYDGAGIKYIHNKKERLYIPDFVVDEFFIVEIKGHHRHYDSIVVDLKRRALESSLIETNFSSLFIEGSKLDSLLKKRARKWHYANQIEKDSSL